MRSCLRLPATAGVSHCGRRRSELRQVSPFAPDTMEGRQQSCRCKNLLNECRARQGNHHHIDAILLRVRDARRPAELEAVRAQETPVQSRTTTVGRSNRNEGLREIANARDGGVGTRCVQAATISTMKLRRCCSRMDPKWYRRTRSHDHATRTSLYTRIRDQFGRDRRPFSE